ncbi:carbohydrate ABC transporter permease [Bifidobacterium breve]|uniref:carbohydrate ABC transporter permease n=1 Tax=Bifidobacterium breve TaxID=1685 RepID=UPI00080B70B8|nr:carbohydrate ABC transporter permease [Bifidobacterium breve]
MSEKVKHPVLWATLFTIISLAWVFPIVLVVINSFKQKAYISRNAFSIPTGKAFVGLQNYTRGIKRTNLIESFGWTVVVTVGAVLLILLCTSMCAWWIVRVNNRTAKSLYLLFLFNMIVPFQMVMFTLSKIADMLGLNTPWGLWIVYLGFGAGLAVFIFTGVIKGIPQELEESAMIDGASVPRIFFQITLPIMRPSVISLAILQAMWIWNDFLLPYLTLDMRRFKTMSIAIQYLKGGYGSVDMGAMMGCLVLAIIPIIIFYLVCQKYIIKGVMAGAVKG